MIEIIPAIDIIGGKCTRLSQGDYATQKDYGGDPAEWARAYADCGVRRLHLVDLEGAKASKPKNLRTLEEDDEALASVWNAGADEAIIGSIAAKEPARMTAWLERWGPRVILGADVRDGKVAVSGWLEDSGIGLDELIETFLPAGLKRAIVTDISRDGMLQGPSFDLYKGLQERYPELTTIVSGGVSSLDDVRRADEMGLPGIIVGKAIYENRITLKDLATCLQNG